MHHKPTPITGMITKIREIQTGKDNKYKMIG